MFNVLKDMSEKETDGVLNTLKVTIFEKNHKILKKVIRA